MSNAINDCVDDTEIDLSPPEMPVLARKWHYIAHFCSKLPGTNTSVWIGRRYKEKGAYMCFLGGNMSLGE